MNYSDVERGLQSKFCSRIYDSMDGFMLCDETVAIIALICEQCKTDILDYQLKSFVEKVTITSNLMPAGSTLKSRQVIAMIAMSVGMR